MQLPQSPWSFWRLAGAMLVVFIVGFALWFALFTGPRDLTRYPSAGKSPYKLPWTAGVERLCIQGNRGVVSHRDGEEFAYDFAMPVGSDICAARAGVVERVEDSHDGNGFHAPNNYVCVRHTDGTLGRYLHIKQSGARVQVGDKVKQGEVIAASGSVGHSLLPHLHFHVQNAKGALVRVSFADVDNDADAGVPRMFKRYISRNSGR